MLFLNVIVILSCMAPHRLIFINCRRCRKVFTAKLVCAGNARSSDVLCSLYRLPIDQRIKFKLASLTFKLLQHQSPSYLASLIIPYMPSRALRPQGQQLLAKLRVKTAIGSRALRVAAPAIWNSLPLHVRQFPLLRPRSLHMQIVWREGQEFFFKPQLSGYTGAQYDRLYKCTKNSVYN